MFQGSSSRINQQGRPVVYATIVYLCCLTRFVLAVLTTTIERGLCVQQPQQRAIVSFQTKEDKRVVWCCLVDGPSNFALTHILRYDSGVADSDWDRFRDSIILFLCMAMTDQDDGHPPIAPWYESVANNSRTMMRQSVAKGMEAGCARQKKWTEDAVTHFTTRIVDSRTRVMWTPLCCRLPICG